MAVFKSVGAYVATDGLAIANAALPGEGARRRWWSATTRASPPPRSGADSRITLAGIRIPVLEPSSNQEIKDFVRLAFDALGRGGLIVGVVVTTTQADGTGVVEVAPNVAPAVGPRRRVDARHVGGARCPTPSPCRPTPPTSRPTSSAAPARPCRRASTHWAWTARTPCAPSGLRRVGIVTAGASYPLLRHALAALGLDGLVPVLRLGLTWPRPPRRTSPASPTRVDEVVVMEERIGPPRGPGAPRARGPPPAGLGQALPRRARASPRRRASTPDIAARCLARLVLLPARRPSRPRPRERAERAAGAPTAP